MWLGIKIQKGLSVTGAVVTEKVLMLHSHCVGYEIEEKASLCANKVWFAKVEKCVIAHSLKREEYFNIRSYFYLGLPLATPGFVKLRSQLSENLSF
jgi:hypothetical protein